MLMHEGLAMLRSAIDSYTRTSGWQVQDAIMQMANVYGITFSGNSFGFDSNCARSQVHEKPAKTCICPYPPGSGSSATSQVDVIRIYDYDKP